MVQNFVGYPSSLQEMFPTINVDIQKVFRKRQENVQTNEKKEIVDINKLGNYTQLPPFVSTQVKIKTG